MTKLKRVGFFQELKHGSSDGPSLRALARPRGATNEERVVAYLDAGVSFIVSPGMVRDVLDNSIIGTLAILTDGTYAWPSDLAHYVKKHHVELPGEFVAHVESQGYLVPTGIDPRTLTLE